MIFSGTIKSATKIMRSSYVNPGGGRCRCWIGGYKHLGSRYEDGSTVARGGRPDSSSTHPCSETGEVKKFAGTMVKWKRELGILMFKLWDATQNKISSKAMDNIHCTDE